MHLTTMRVVRKFVRNPIEVYEIVLFESIVRDYDLYICKCNTA